MKKILFWLVCLFFSDRIFAQNVPVALSALPAKLKAIYVSKAPVGAKFISPATQNKEENGSYVIKWTKAKLNGTVVFLENSDGTFSHACTVTENFSGADVAALVPAPIQQKLKQIVPKTQLSACTWTRTAFSNGSKRYVGITKIDENTQVSLEIVQVPNLVTNNFILEITGKNILTKLSELMDIAQFEKATNISETIEQKRQDIMSFIANKNYIISDKKITFDGTLHPTSGKKGMLNVTFNADVKDEGNLNFVLFHKQQVSESKGDK